MEVIVVMLSCINISLFRTLTICFIRSLVSIFVLCSISNAYGPPDYLPNGAHPRIWLKSDKLTQLRTKACVDAGGNTIGTCTVAPE